MNNIPFYQNTAASYDRACRQYLTDSAIRELLEDFRAQPDPEQIEVLLCVLKLHLTSLSVSAKESVLLFLYEMLAHRDGEVRRSAAGLAGRILAGHDTAAWKAFLRRILFSNVLLPEQQRRWVGFALKYVLQSLLACSERRKQKEMLKVLTEYYKSTKWDTLTCFFLMDCASRIPYALCNDSQRKMLLGFARYFLSSPDRELCCAALIFTDYWLEEGAGDGLNMEPYYDLFSQISRDDPSAGMRMLAKEVLQAGDDMPLKQQNDILDHLLLENRSLEVPWIIKQVNLRILRRETDRANAANNGSDRLGQYASGLLNMLQFSAHIVNRLQAEEDLRHLVPMLRVSACFDAATELLRAIETGDENIFRYVPPCLGYLYTSLPADNRIYLKDRLFELVDSRSDKVVSAVIRTAVTILEIGSEDYEDFLGLLCCGLSHDHSPVSLYTLYLTGRRLYDPSLEAGHRKAFHLYLAGKIPCFMPDVTDRYSLLCHHAAFNAIADFLSERGAPDPDLTGGDGQKIAFVPGAFDPFSLGNRAVVREITQMGFAVYLCADEFSWSRRVQPLRIRQRILAMSVADLKNAFLFPEDVQINIANPDDLRILKQMFPGKEVYLVAGSDVIENASAYKKAPQPDSVHSFPHIVFSRNMNLSYEAGEALQKKLPPESIWLKLPSFYEHMNAAVVRDNVFHGKDISDLVVRRVQNYIYEHNLYAAGEEESMKKRTPRVRPVLIESGQSALTGETCIEVMTVSDPVSAADLFSSEKDIRDAEGRIRGRIHYMVDGTTARLLSIENAEGSGFGGALAAMEEFLMRCKMDGITRVFGQTGKEWESLLEMFGFVPSENDHGFYEVSLIDPVVLFSDTSYSIRDTYAGTPSVREAVHRAQMRLLRSAAGLMPGHAVLRAEAETLSYRLLQLVSKANPPVGDPYAARQVGAMTCVPLGKLFHNTVIPGCVTKDLYIEKEYSEDLGEASVTHTASSAPLTAQVRMIRSLMRPVMLLDDIYSLDQNGSAVCSLFTQEHASVGKFIVGLVAGNGPVSSDAEPVDLDAVYRVPDASLVLSEAELYPFISGCSVRNAYSRYGIPSVNPILPYQYPSLPEGVSTDAFYRFSTVCMENTLDICRAIEEEYFRKSGRRLTLPRMREVFAEVRLPDLLAQTPALENETPSGLLQKELKRLGRLRNLS